MVTAVPKEGNNTVLTAFDGTSSSVDSTILEWRWRFPFAVNDYVNQHAYTTFLDNGLYPVTLTTIDSQLLTLAR